jgi:histidinol-phosphatase (PHP family)
MGSAVTRRSLLKGHGPCLLKDYLREVKALKALWAGELDVLCGLEIDFIPNLTGPENAKFQDIGLDYTIGSVHFVDEFRDGTPWEVDGDTALFVKGLEKIFHGDIRKMVGRYYELIRYMIMLETPDILGHLDKIKLHNQQQLFFAENEEWYRREVFRTLQTIATTDTLVEVNTRGLYLGKTLELYPSRWVLEEIRQMGIRIVLSSDAHHPTQVAAGFQQAVKVLRDMGFTHSCVMSNGRWIEKPFSRQDLRTPVNYRESGKSRIA